VYCNNQCHKDSASGRCIILNFLCVVVYIDPNNFFKFWVLGLFISKCAPLCAYLQGAATLISSALMKCLYSYMWTLAVSLTCAHYETHCPAASSELPTIFREVIRPARGKWCSWDGKWGFSLLLKFDLYSIYLSSLLRFLLSFAEQSIFSPQCSQFESLILVCERCNVCDWVIDMSLNWMYRESFA